MKKYFPWLVARLFLGGIFIFSGFLKLTEPVEIFRGMIVSYGIVPYQWVGLIAHVLPWLEFIFGICLVVGFFPRYAALGLAALALSFIGLITIAYFHGTLPENCGCFGEGVHMSPYQMFLLDTLNALLAIRLTQIKTHRICVAA